MKALSYGLDYRIPSKTISNAINKEFETFYQSILDNISILSIYIG